MTATAPKPPEADLSRVSKALKGTRFALILVVVFSFFANLLMLTGPLYMLQIYDRVLTSGSIPTLVALSLLAFALYALFGFLDFVRGRILLRVGRLVEENLSSRIFQVISFHAIRRSKNVRSQPAHDINSLRNFFAGPAPFAFLDLPWVPVYLFVIFLMHSWLGIASLIAVAILAMLMVLNTLLTNRHLTQAQASTTRANSINDEARRNIEVAHVMGMLTNLRNRWLSIQTTAMDQQTRASDRGAAVSTLSKTMRMMFQSGILGLGAYLAVQQEITPGTMIAASIIMARALAPVEQVVTYWRGAHGARKAWRRLDGILRQTPPEKEQMPLPEPQARLSVEKLVALKPDSGEPLIAGVSFNLDPGSGLGIIGPTGAGKTTLARAIIGSWPHLRGEVRFDGARLDQWNPDQLGRHFGYLSQDVELFDGTIGENISRFDPTAQPDAIVEAAKAALVHELVLSFNDGYNTLIGEQGVNLSAGQRQRIGLARALYKHPLVVVLDEPNANLDADGEAALVKAIRETRQRGGIVIVVAHRPSAIAALDLLMVIKDGRPVAFGPKKQVLEKMTTNKQQPSGRPTGITATVNPTAPQEQSK